MKKLDDGIAKSGRRGIWVYYMFRGKQRRRRYVKPRDPRTPGQLRSRADFGAATNAYSHSKELTEEQCERCRRAGAKLRSRARLWQSGPLTGQQFYIRRSRARAKTIRGLALARREGKEATRAGRGLRAVVISRASQFQGVTRPSFKSRRVSIVGSRGQSRPAKGYARNVGAKRMPNGRLPIRNGRRRVRQTRARNGTSQVQHYQ